MLDYYNYYDTSPLKQYLFTPNVLTVKLLTDCTKVPLGTELNYTLTVTNRYV